MHWINVVSIEIPEVHFETTVGVMAPPFEVGLYCLSGIEEIILRVSLFQCFSAAQNGEC